MAVIRMTKSSVSLGKRTHINIFVPDQLKEGTKTLYLLHGLSDNNDDWFNNTQLVRAVANRNLVVVCPDGGKSFYSNMKSNYNYFDYIAKELPEYIEKLFPVTGKDEDRYIAGLSMGGYGAFKFALSFPERYAGAASFSGVMDVISRMENGTFDYSGIKDEEIGPKGDLFALAKMAEKSVKKPKLYQWCGTSDFLYEDNKKFRDFIKDMDFDYTYKESEGDHNWECWNEQIKFVLDFFSL